MVRRHRAFSSPGKACQVRLWPYPFRVYGFIATDEGRKKRKLEADAQGTDLRGRELWLAGYLDAAPAALREDSDTGLYFRGVTAYEKGDMPAARSAFDRLLQKYPGTAWRIPALVHRARALEMEGDYKAAIETYWKIDNPDGNIRDRLHILRTNPENIMSYRCLPCLGVYASREGQIPE